MHAVYVNCHDSWQRFTAEMNKEIMQLNRKRYSLINIRDGYLFCLPFIILLGIFILFPLIKGVYNSLFNFRFGGAKFVGLDNYTRIFSRDIYLLAMKNTLVMVFITVPALVILGIAISGAIFDKSMKYASFVRVCLYLPVIASAAVMSIIFRFILDSQLGLLRYFFDVIGKEPFNVLGDPIGAMGVIIFMLIAMNLGQCVVLYVAAMLSVPSDIIEALELDGGNRLSLFRYILIPHCSPTTLLVLITQTTAVLRAFVVIQLLTNGGPSYATTNIMYLLYREGFANGNFGLASALGVLMFLFCIILVLLQFRVMRISKEG